MQYLSYFNFALCTICILIFSTQTIAGDVPRGYFRAPDGTIFANNPKTAIAPAGYVLKRNGVLVKIDANPAKVKKPKPEKKDNPSEKEAQKLSAAKKTSPTSKNNFLFEMNYSFTNLADMLDTTKKVTASQAVSPSTGGGYGYKIAPEDMSQQVIKAIITYNINKKFSIMGTGQYLKNNMSMLGSDNSKSTMSSSGIGDTLFDGFYRGPYHLTFNLGLSIPTGDINIKGALKESADNIRQNAKYAYNMQLGSGSYDIKHGIAYSDNIGMIYWGVGYEYTARINENNNNYKLGKLLIIDNWVRWNINKKYRTSFNITYYSLAQIDGNDPDLDPKLSPTMDASNYGGNRVDLGLGAQYIYSIYNFSGQIFVPVYQNLWGPQLATKWMANLNFGVAF